MRPLAPVLAATLLGSVASAEAPRPLIVATRTGLHEVGVDGVIVRTVSKAPAALARWSAHGLLYFLTPGNRQLRVVPAAGGEARTIATLPRRFTTKTEAAEHPAGSRFTLDQLAVQSDEDFTLDAAGKTACVSLKDRNLNMMDIDVAVAIDLETGAVHTAILYPDDASLPSGCPGPTADEREPPPAPFAIEEGALVRRQDGAATVQARVGGEFAAESTSPSGRWQVLGGNQEEGDLIHRQLLLLDRREGRIWTVARRPRALSARELGRAGRGVRGTEGVVGETTVSWLGERLLVDRLLVTPAVGAVTLPGAPAR